MYYLEMLLTEHQYPRVGKFLGGFYAVALVIGCFGIGNMFQSNQAYVQFVNVTGGSKFFWRARLAFWNDSGSHDWGSRYWWYTLYR